MRILGFILLFLCSCAINEDQTLPETIISYGVSSTDKRVYEFTVHFIDGNGNTISRGPIIDKAWSSPTYTDKFKRGDQVEIRIVAKDSQSPLSVNIYYNYYLLESQLLQGSSELTVSSTIP